MFVAWHGMTWYQHCAYSVDDVQVRGWIMNLPSFKYIKIKFNKQSNCCSFVFIHCLPWCFLFQRPLHVCIAVYVITNWISPGSSSNPRASQSPRDFPSLDKKTSNLNRLLSKWGSSRKRCLIRHTLLSNNDCGLVGYRKYYSSSYKARRRTYLLPSASSDDGVTVNGSPQAKTSTDLEKMRIKLNKSLEDEDIFDGLLQSLYDASRVFELAIKEQSLFSRASWFSTAWLGIDQNAWAKTLSYQVLSFMLFSSYYFC